MNHEDTKTRRLSVKGLRILRVFVERFLPFSPWVALGLVLILAAGLAVHGPAQAAPAPAGAQQATSTCLACHETAGKNPVRGVGQWHVQHEMLSCEICHGGNPAAATQEEAHAGQMTNPLAAGTSCALCHPDTAQEYIATYQAMITPEAPTVEATGTEAAAPPAVPTEAPAGATAMDSATPAGPENSCRVVATECVPAGITTGAPAAVVTPTATLTPAAPVTATLAAAAAASPASTPLPAGAAAGAVAASTPAAGSTTGSGGFSWMAALQFTRGPLFKAAFWFFVLGMLLRLVQALRSGWKHHPAEDKTGRAAGVGKSFLTGLLVLPFLPGVKGAFRHRPVIYLAGGLFHLGLLAVVLFSKTHMSAWKSVTGVGWPVLPAQAVHWLAAIGIVAMLALLINRIVDPVLRLISGPAEWLNWLVVFLPMLSGFILARRLAPVYEASFSIHMLLVDILLIWIPLSRISHFVFYFFSRAIHGVEFNTRRVAA